jgi:hypothetical protein
MAPAIPVARRITVFTKEHDHEKQFPYDSLEGNCSKPSKCRLVPANTLRYDPGRRDTLHARAKGFRHARRTAFAAEGTIMNHIVPFLVALYVLVGTGLSIMASPYFVVLFLAIGGFIALSMLRH